MSDVEKCKICNENCSKYKCPTCLIKYCSVNCYKTHKDQECMKPISETQKKTSETESNGQIVNYEFETEDTVPPERLKLLGTNQKVLSDLQNPHLRDILSHLDSLDDPSCAIGEAMREPIFAEFVTKCLKVVEGNHEESDSDESDE